MDPEGGYLPFDMSGVPYRAVKWIDRGVLTALPYDRAYARRVLREEMSLPNPLAYRFHGIPGDDTSIEEMRGTTARGLLVTRFADVHVLDPSSLLLTGITQNGVWLIERGKITTAVKNMRFLESPMAMCNNIVAVGAAVRVYGHRRGEAYRSEILNRSECANNTVVASRDEVTLDDLVPAVVPSLQVREFNFVSLADAL
jgi:predicted Zn-dependent protease